MPFDPTTPGIVYQVPTPHHPFSTVKQAKQRCRCLPTYAGCLACAPLVPLLEWRQRGGAWQPSDLPRLPAPLHLPSTTCPHHPPTYHYHPATCLSEREVGMGVLVNLWKHTFTAARTDIAAFTLYAPMLLTAQRRHDLVLVTGVDIFPHAPASRGRRRQHPFAFTDLSSFSHRRTAHHNWRTHVYK